MKQQNLTTEEWITGLVERAKVLRPSLVPPSPVWTHQMAIALEYEGFNKYLARRAELWILFGAWFETKKQLSAADFYPETSKIAHLGIPRSITIESHAKILRQECEKVARETELKCHRPIPPEMLDQAKEIVRLSSDNADLVDKLAKSEQRLRYLENVIEGLRARNARKSGSDTGTERSISKEFHSGGQTDTNASQTNEM